MSENESIMLCFGKQVFLLRHMCLVDYIGCEGLLKLKYG